MYSVDSGSELEQPIDWNYIDRSMNIKFPDRRILQHLITLILLQFNGAGSKPEIPNEIWCYSCRWLSEERVVNTLPPESFHLLFWLIWWLCLVTLCVRNSYPLWLLVICGSLWKICPLHHKVKHQHEWQTSNNEGWRTIPDTNLQATKRM